MDEPLATTRLSTKSYTARRPFCKKSRKQFNMAYQHTFLFGRKQAEEGQGLPAIAQSFHPPALAAPLVGFGQVVGAAKVPQFLVSAAGAPGLTPFCPSGRSILIIRNSGG